MADPRSLGRWARLALAFGAFGATLAGWCAFAVESHGVSAAPSRAWPGLAPIASGDARIDALPPMVTALTPSPRARNARRPIPVAVTRSSR